MSSNDSNSGRGGPSDAIGDTIRGMFETGNRSMPSNPYQEKSRGKSKFSKQENEYALTMILVEIANSAGAFGNLEFQVLAQSLQRMFGTELFEVNSMIQKALKALGHMRGATKYAEYLVSALPGHEIKTVMQCIDLVVFRNGMEPKGFELFLRDKYRKIFAPQTAAG